jgi:hypothetical protein
MPRLAKLALQADLWYYIGRKYCDRGDAGNIPRSDERRVSSLMKISVSLVTRFWLKVDRRGDNECWLWTASTTGNGYGQFSPTCHPPKTGYAHRFSYELHYGPIPAGMLVCHTCDNPRCVNPKHLFLGTHQDNATDMKQKGRHWNGSHRYSRMAKKKEQ